MEKIDTSEKLKRILKGFLSENYKVTNDSYLEMFFTHLSEKEHGKLLQLPCILEWFEECLMILEKDFNKLNPNVVALFFKICALYTQNEWLVIHVREKQLAERLDRIIIANHKNLPPAIKLGHVRFLAAVSRYTLGLRWIKQSGAWRHLIDYCQKNQTVYVVRESMKLLYEILYKYSVKANDEELTIEIIREVVRPLLENVFKENATTVSVDDSDLQPKLSPTLDLISYILQKTLESDIKTKIPYIMSTEFKVDMNLWKLADMTQNSQFLGKILRAHSSFNFAMLIYEKWSHNGKIAAEDFNQFGVNFFNYMKFCASRKSCTNMLMMAELNHILWKKLKDRVPEEIMIENERIQFENQLIMLQLLPLLFILRKNASAIFDDYIIGLFVISSRFLMQICYTFRDVMLENSSIAPDLAHKSINSILSLGNGLDQHRAVLTFQGMMYLLKMFTPDEDDNSKDRSSKTELLVKIPNVLFAVLVGLQSLIQRYRITWKDSIETICLLNFLLVLLKDPNLTSRLTVQAIKLTQLSIEHFLSPNLALLIDNINESGMRNLGPMILKRLHDTEWEVRDSTLELVTSITQISTLKYPAFQQYILDNGICPVVYSMCKNDMEPYVRASAYKCLAEMVTINLLWEKSLCQFDLMDHLLSSLCTETEGIVRKEAVLLITKIYRHRKIPTNYMECLFSTMIHCCVKDLHWEVKQTALYFWKVLVCHEFTNQGMIDGTFPTVTFSKEYKKIVTLTEKEILLRIKKILNELSQRGCLGVVLCCLNDDCDLEVVKTAVQITKRLFSYLNKYEYLKLIESMPPGCGSSNNSKNQLKTNAIEENNENNFEGPVNATQSGNDVQQFDSDQVIESIVSAHDINLLVQAYENQMQVDNDIANVKQKKIDENFYKAFANVAPSDFIAKVNSMDLDSLIEKRTNWLTNTESFDSLLDDMLFSIKILEVNDADCY